MEHHGLKWYVVLWENAERQRNSFLMSFTLDNKPVIDSRSRTAISSIKEAINNKRSVDFVEPKVSQVLFLNGEYLQ